MINYWIQSDLLHQNIFIPKYYDPSIEADLDRLSGTHRIVVFRTLVSDGIITVSTGHEVGKSSYGTGDIPFIRTSDIANWEIRSFPKQGLSGEIYSEYAERQDVRAGDILLVKDGTYLIGHNCFITEADKQLLYQSHIYKIRVEKADVVSPEILFLLLNSSIVQRQIRNVQFTADIIDTIGSRINEVRLPIPVCRDKLKNLEVRTRCALNTRVSGKLFIKHAADLIEAVLQTESVAPLNEFLSLSSDEMISAISNRTITSEFGEFESFWRRSNLLKDGIHLPSYYDPSVDNELKILSETSDLEHIAALKRKGEIYYNTGDEIGKMAYGTGDIPFIRTSDFANWEIKYNPKQGISEKIYEQYASKQDVRAHDIFLVRDGTYLVGSSCIITEYDAKCLFSGGLYKIRASCDQRLNCFLMLALLNSYVVKRQLRTKQFTRDVIDTIGKRIGEVYLPIPKSRVVRNGITNAVRQVVSSRIEARREIVQLSELIVQEC